MRQNTVDPFAGNKSDQHWKRIDVTVIHRTKSHELPPKGIHQGDFGRSFRLAVLFIAIPKFLRSGAVACSHQPVGKASAMNEKVLSTSSPDLLHRIRAEFNEMPGLRLTFHQAQRLWGLDEKTCLNALAELVGSGFLARNAGHYSRRSTSPRMVKADLAHPAKRRLAG